MKIGVFDSGVGGLSVANAISRELPEHEIVYREDKANVPYGTKPLEQLLRLVLPILEQMVEEGCAVIVIACNTVTTNIIGELRQRFSVPLIGMEPMVKQAAGMTESGIIAVCATPATLKSDRYAWLKTEYAKGIEVVEPDCHDWASLIESNELNLGNIQEDVDMILDSGADVIVLGCTHYHWIEDMIKRLVANKAEVLQPEQPVIEQLKRVLAQRQ